MWNYRLVYMGKNITWSTVQIYMGSSCIVWEGPMQNMYNVTPGLLRHFATVLLDQVCYCPCPQPLRAAPLSSSVPKIPGAPSWMKFCNSHPRIWDVGLASTGTHEGLLLAACMSSLTEIKILFILPQKLHSSQQNNERCLTHYFCTQLSLLELKQTWHFSPIWRTGSCLSCLQLGSPD